MTENDLPEVRRQRREAEDDVTGPGPSEGAPVEAPSPLRGLPGPSRIDPGQGQQQPNSQPPEGQG